MKQAVKFYSSLTIFILTACLLGFALYTRTYPLKSTLSLPTPIPFQTETYYEALATSGLSLDVKEDEDIHNAEEITLDLFNPRPEVLVAIFNKNKVAVIERHGLVNTLQKRVSSIETMLCKFFFNIVDVMNVVALDPVSFKFRSSRLVVNGREICDGVEGFKRLCVYLLSASVKEVN